ncbi:MAG: M48 family metallopeptidase [Chloroflexi bacterium]|nr:M48 family metallopeptidase [Chloroflexota bacterium]
MPSLDVLLTRSRSPFRTVAIVSDPDLSFAVSSLTITIFVFPSAAAAPPLIQAWEVRLAVTVSGFYVRKMKTLWGSCNPRARTIRLNTELAKKPRACLEYIVLHEMVHLLEPSHGPKFRVLMDQHMPAWREKRQELNRLPIGHEDWGY